MTAIVAFIVGVAVGHFGVSKIVAFLKARLEATSNPIR